MTAPAVEKVIDNALHPGERVFVAHGVYQGTVGHFIGSRPDADWADVLEETRGVVRTHPVQWLRHCPEGRLVWSELLSSRD